MAEDCRVEKLKELHIRSQLWDESSSGLVTHACYCLILLEISILHAAWII